MSVRFRQFSLVTAVAACALLLAACSNPSAAMRAEVAPFTTRTATPSTKHKVVAIGDSIMRGSGLSPAEAWPALLAANNGWDLSNLACDGAGFGVLGDSDECDSDFAGLVAETVSLHPDLILISGSSNDLGIDNDTLVVQTNTVVTMLRSALPTTTIVGVSTVWNDTDAPGQIDDINAQVSEAMRQVGGVYLDIGQPLTGHRDWLQSDDVHPTAEGQRVLTQAIDAALHSANVTAGG